ncbi:TonB-dependent receptor domain-containing protein, partial [Termitidicoccus mucosus]
IRADWRVTPRLALGASLNYSVSDLWHRQRNLILDTPIGANYAARPANSLAIVAGDNPMQAFEVTGVSTSYVTSESRNVVQSGRYVSPEARLEYKTRNLAIDARVGYADSKSEGDSYGKKGAAYLVRGRASGVAYRVTRSPGLASPDYTITQLGGPDLADGASYTGDRAIYMEDGRKTTAKVLNAQANASLMTRWLWPVHWKTGVKSREEKRTFDENVNLNQWAYTANASHADFKSPYDYDFGRSGVSLATTGGGTVWTPDTSAIADAYRDDAGLDPADKLFSKVTTADQYYAARVTYHRNFIERVDAGYLMATTTFFNKRISARAGLRYENTTNQIREADSYTSQQVIDYVNSLPAGEQLQYRQGGAAAGAIVNADGRAVTIPGIDYQFLSRPWIRKESDYDHLFPSASLKYNILANLNLQLGFSTTIRRPDYGDLIGVTIVDNDDSIIRIANKHLKPERARNFAARLAWYPKGAGAVSLALYQNNVQNKIQSNLTPVADYDPALAAEYPGYMVSSRFNSAAGVTIRSMELAFRRDLGFIAPAFRPVTFRASYTRTYAEILQPAADEKHVSGLVPHTVNAGLTYAHRGVSFNINWNWNDTYPFSTTGLSLNRHRSRTDISGDWRLSRHYTVSFSIRNLFDDPYVELKNIAPGPLVMSRYMRTGSVISLSVKGEW